MIYEATVFPFSSSLILSKLFCIDWRLLSMALCQHPGPNDRHDFSLLLCFQSLIFSIKAKSSREMCLTKRPIYVWCMFVHRKNASLCTDKHLSFLIIQSHSTEKKTIELQSNIFLHDQEKLHFKWNERNSYLIDNNLLTTIVFLLFWTKNIFAMIFSNHEYLRKMIWWNKIMQKISLTSMWWVFSFSLHLRVSLLFPFVA